MAKKKNKSCSCTTIISWIVTTIAIAFLFAGRFYVRLYSILPPYSLVATGAVIAISILVQLYLCCKPHKKDVNLEVKPKSKESATSVDVELSKSALEAMNKFLDLQKQTLEKANPANLNPPEVVATSNSKTPDKPKPIIDIIETKYLIESKDGDVKEPEITPKEEKFAFWTYTKEIYFEDAEGEFQQYTFEDEEIYRDTEIDDSCRLEEYKIDPSTSKPIVALQEVDKCYFNHYDIYYTVILLNPADDPIKQWNIIQLKGYITKCEHSTILGYEAFRITYYYQTFDDFNKACATAKLPCKAISDESKEVEVEYGCITDKPLHPSCQFKSFKENPCTNLQAIADSFPVLSKYIDEVKEHKKRGVA